MGTEIVFERLLIRGGTEFVMPITVSRDLSHSLVQSQSDKLLV